MKKCNVNTKYIASVKTKQTRQFLDLENQQNDISSMLARKKNIFYACVDSKLNYSILLSSNFFVFFKIRNLGSPANL